MLKSLSQEFHEYPNIKMEYRKKRILFYFICQTLCVEINFVFVITQALLQYPLCFKTTNYSKGTGVWPLSVCSALLRAKFLSNPRRIHSGQKDEEKE
jgi:hypothetical protein